MKKLAYIFGFGILSSCVQRYDAPPVATPEVSQYKSVSEKAASYASCPEPEQVLLDASFHPWWKVFNDEELNSLEYQAIKESPKVAQAQARLEEAMAFYGIERSYLFPQIDLDITASRQRISQTQSLAGSANSAQNANVVSKAANPPMIPATNPCVICPPPPMCACPTPKTPSPLGTSLGILPVLTYELDFWGKNLQAAESAMQQVRAEQEDLQNTLLQLTASVGDAYLQVRTFDQELEILNKTLVTRQQNVRYNEMQFQAGLINDLAVQLAKSDLESVAQDIEETTRLRALAEHELAALVGKPASTFTLRQKQGVPTLPRLSEQLPSSMLERRPDLRQAKALIEASALAVGVAKTAYFPDFTLTLDYGFVSSHANKLFKWKSRTWLAAVDVVTPLFTAGQISSTIDQAIAQYKQTVASYLDLVLVAFKEVENSLFSIEATKKRLTHLTLEIEASQKAYDIALLRYKMGLENYINVVNTERTLLVAERAKIQVTREQFSNTISLINSLGGYWNRNDENSPCIARRN